MAGREPSAFPRLAGFYAAYFLAVGVYMPYWPLWLDSRGLSPEEIGWVLAGAFWIKVAAQPAVARIADRGGRTRRLTAALAAASACAFAVLSGAEGFWAVAVLAAVAAACHQPVLPVMESVALRRAAADGLDYGRVRLWGSVAFIAATAGAGRWLDGRDAGGLVWIVAGAMALVALSCALAPERPRGAEPPGARRGAGAATGGARGRPAIARVFTPAFVALLAAAGAIHASHSVLYGFGSLHWRAIGIGETAIGAFWAVGVAAEIALFAVAGRARLGAGRLLALAAVAATIRWPLLAVAESVPLVLAAQLLHGLSFGAAHLGAMAVLSRAVPPELSATGQGVFYALVGGVLSGCAMPLAGRLFGALGADAFWVMAAIAAAALVPALWLDRRAA